MLRDLQTFLNLRIDSGRTSFLDHTTGADSETAESVILTINHFITSNTDTDFKALQQIMATTNQTVSIDKGKVTFTKHSSEINIQRVMLSILTIKTYDSLLEMRYKRLNDEHKTTLTLEEFRALIERVQTHIRHATAPIIEELFMREMAVIAGFARATLETLDIDKISKIKDTISRTKKKIQYSNLFLLSTILEAATRKAGKVYAPYLAEALSLKPEESNAGAINYFRLELVQLFALISSWSFWSRVKYIENQRRGLSLRKTPTLEFMTRFDSEKREHVKIVNLFEVMSSSTSAVITRFPDKRMEEFTNTLKNTKLLEAAIQADKEESTRTSEEMEAITEAEAAARAGKSAGAGAGAGSSTPPRRVSESSTDASSDGTPSPSAPSMSSADTLHAALTCSKESEALLPNDAEATRALEERKAILLSDPLIPEGAKILIGAGGLDMTAAVDGLIHKIGKKRAVGILSTTYEISQCP